VRRPRIGGTKQEADQGPKNLERHRLGAAGVGACSILVTPGPAGSRGRTSRGWRPARSDGRVRQPTAPVRRRSRPRAESRCASNGLSGWAASDRTSRIAPTQEQAPGAVLASGLAGPTPCSTASRPRSVRLRVDALRPQPDSDEDRADRAAGPQAGWAAASPARSPGDDDRPEAGIRAWRQRGAENPGERTPWPIDRSRTAG